VPALDRPLDARDEHDAALPRMSGQSGVFKLTVVERDGQRVEPERRRPIDQGIAVVGDAVHRIVVGVEVKVYFEHVGSPTEAPRRPR
jgi:hypothetical protein